VFILKGVKVVCFETLLQVLILKELAETKLASAVVASPAPGVFVDSRRESKDRIGMHPHPRHFWKRVWKLLKTNDAGAKKRRKRV
jgi:hypothetical protein